MPISAHTGSGTPRGRAPVECGAARGVQQSCPRLSCSLVKRHMRVLLPSSAKRPMTGRELAEKLYREGKLASLATQRPLTQEEQEERERLARLFASDKPAFEMVIEDRGPY